MKIKGQVWIETVIYTLIGLVLIGIVLSMVTPKIDEARERAIVEQTISSMNVLNDKINEVSSSEYNRRIVDFSLKRGSLYINSSGDSIMFELGNLRKPYSELNIPINSGKVEILSMQYQKTNSVYLSLKYSGQYDITYSGKNELKKIGTAQVPYRLLIINKGMQNGLRQIDIEDISGR